jgi:hypothetical protein
MGGAKRQRKGRRTCIGRKRKGQAHDKLQREAAADAAATAVAEAEIHAAPSPVEEPSPQPPQTQQTRKQRQRHTTPTEERLKRAAIEYAFVQLGSPPEALWKGHAGVIVQVRDFLRLPVGCKHLHTIQRTLTAITAEAGDCGRGGGYGGGQCERLTQGEALVAAHELRNGHGQEQAMHTVNAWRRKRGKTDEVSRSAMRSAVLKLGVKRYRRCGTKTGNKDPESKWARARLAQCEQWFAQLGREEPEVPADGAEAEPERRTLTIEGYGPVEMALVDPFGVVGDTVLVPNQWWNAGGGSTRCRIDGYVSSLAPPLPPKKRKAAANPAADPVSGPPSYALHWNGQHFAMTAEYVRGLLSKKAQAAIAAAATAAAAAPSGSTDAVAPPLKLVQILWSD